MANPPYGFWTFNNHMNGLEGAESTFEFLPDGRMVVVKNPDYPATLEDDFILYALRTSKVARSDYIRLFPSLDSESQGRLTALLAANPWARKLIETEQAFLDRVQKKEVVAGVHVRLPRPSL